MVPYCRNLYDEPPCPHCQKILYPERPELQNQIETLHNERKGLQEEHRNLEELYKKTK
jgi:hypothetical protein